MTTDPRALQLAQHRQHITHENTNGSVQLWDGLTKGAQQIKVQEAEAYLRAAVEAGLMPPADRPTDKHSAIWLDEEGFVYGEYQTSPSSHGDAILRLVWESEVCSSKRDLEDQGAEFRLIGWST
ncbi:hypothetical protein [Streptomyces sp. NPDC020747]|uniref:hypothetical protein n=1 Tax=Streptomyces sp. NPDC020747 TaxID=3365086 RepID=UPI003791CBC0